MDLILELISLICEHQSYTADPVGTEGLKYFMADVGRSCKEIRVRAWIGACSNAARNEIRAKSDTLR